MPNRFVPRIQDVWATRFDAGMGWDAIVELAKMYGGVAMRDELPGNQGKTYYWSIVNLGLGPMATQTGQARPGDWIIHDSRSGELSVMHDDEFRRSYMRG